MDSENHNHLVSVIGRLQLCAEGKCEKCGRLLSKHEDRCPDHSHAAVRTLGKRR